MSRKNRLKRKEAAVERPDAGGGVFRYPYWLVLAALPAWFFAVYRSYFPAHPLSATLSAVTRVDYTAVLSGFLGALPSAASGLLFFVLLVVLCRGLGGGLLSLFRLVLPAGERFIVSLGLGLGALAYLMLLLGAVGGLHKGLILSLFLSGAAVSAYASRIWRIRTEGLKDAAAELLGLGAGWKALALIAGLFCILNAVMAFVPETFYDSHVYHLTAPEHYLFKHRIAPLRFLSHSNFPLNMSMIYALALSLGGELLAKMVHCLTGLLAAAMLYLAARRLYNVKAALLAVLIFCSTPIFAINSWTCGNDVGLAFFFTLAYAAYLDWLRTGEDARFLLMSVFAGISMGMKYTAFFCVAALGAALGLSTLRSYGPARAARKVLLYSAVVFLFLLPWLVKNYVFTGNPVQPFFNTVLGGENLRVAGEGGVVGFNTTLSTVGFKALDMLFSPWTLTRSGSDSLTFIGPIFLLLSPCLLFFRRTDRFIKHSLVLFLIGYAAWYMGTTAYRYILQMFPVLALCLGWSAWQVAERFKVFLPVFAAMFLVNFASVLALAVPLGLGPYFAQGASKDGFLSVSQVSYPNPPYAAIKWCNEHLPKDARVLFIGESRPFRLERDFLSYSIEINIQPLTAYLRRAETPERFYELLRADGFTHLLVNYREAIRNVPYKEFPWTAEQRKVFDAFWKEHAALEYFKEGVYVYRIFPDKGNEGTPDILEGLETAGWTHSGLLKLFVENKMWGSCLDEYGAYARYGYDVRRQIEYFKALSEKER